MADEKYFYHAKSLAFVGGIIAHLHIISKCFALKAGEENRFPKHSSIHSRIPDRKCGFKAHSLAFPIYLKYNFAVIDIIFLEVSHENNIQAGKDRMKNENKKYYAAYEERYKTVHEQGVSWSSDKNTPIVLETIQKYNLQPVHDLLEIGCGEGRDSKAVLEHGYHLLATDISTEAIAYCKRIMPRFESHFRVLDCLLDELDHRFDFIYAIAVIHMLVLDEDRNGFYQFIRSHLKPKGLALICTMGDGEFEMQSDISRAYEIQVRNHECGKMMVAGTSCRMVSFKTFDDELERNGLEVVEKGITSALPDFNSLMFAVVKRK